MEETKSWYMSKAAIAALVTMALGLLTALGWISPNSEALAETAADNIIGLITAILGLVEFYGRITATKKIK